MRINRRSALALVLAIFSGTPSQSSEPDDADPTATNVPLRPADSDAPMAEGWPPATRPGVIEVKSYPAYRSAKARAREARVGSDNVLFWPLFNHISRRGVAMTAPVVSTYAPRLAEDPKAAGDISMEFIYQSPKTGEAGAGVGPVKVEDHPAASYVCMGFQGGDADRFLLEGVPLLRAWLIEHASEWVEAGPPRRLGYHGPMTPAPERWWEVQIPVKPATGNPADGPEK